MKASLVNRFVVASRFMSDGDGGAEESTTLFHAENASSLAMVSFAPLHHATKLSFKEQDVPKATSAASAGYGL